MEIKNRLTSDLNRALKAGDALKTSVLRMLNAAIHNKEIEKRSRQGDSELTEDETIQILFTEAKKRREASLIFQEGGRNDLKDKELRELEIIQFYLPEQLNASEIEKRAAEILKHSASKDFGSAMKAVMSEFRGKADAKLVSEIVKKLVSGS